MGALPLHRPPPPPPPVAPPVAVAWPGGTSRTICSACHGARACGWAHSSIGPCIAARVGGWQKHAPGWCALGARAITVAQSVPIELTLPSRQRSARSGPLLAHAERAALVWRCAAKRWSIGRAIGHRSVARPSREYRGRLPRQGAALERPDRAATSATETPVGGRRRRAAEQFSDADGLGCNSGCALPAWLEPDKARRPIGLRFTAPCQESASD